MKRLTGALLALLLLLVGCSAGDTGNYAGAPKLVGDEDGDELVLAVPLDADKVLMNAAGFFCDKLRELSGGMVRVRVQPVGNPAGDLAAGRSTFALLDGAGQPEGFQALNLTAAPFMYSSYEDFTMRLNARTTLEAVDTALTDAHPLAAYYQGATCLLSWFDTDSTAFFQEQTIAVNPGTDTGNAFALMNMEVVEAASPDERFRLLLEDEAGAAEFTFAEMNALDWTDAPALYLSFSYHSAQPVWLVANDDWLDEQDARVRAQIDEACAHLISQIDEHHVRAEEEELDELLGLNLILAEDLTGVRYFVQSWGHGYVGTWNELFGPGAEQVLRAIRYAK